MAIIPSVERTVTRQVGGSFTRSAFYRQDVSIYGDFTYTGDVGATDRYLLVWNLVDEAGVRVTPDHPRHSEMVNTFTTAVTGGGYYSYRYPGDPAATFSIPQGMRVYEIILSPWDVTYLTVHSVTLTGLTAAPVADVQAVVAGVVRQVAQVRVGTPSGSDLIWENWTPRVATATSTGNANNPLFLRTSVTGDPDFVTTGTTLGVTITFSAPVVCDRTTNIGPAGTIIPAGTKVAPDETRGLLYTFTEVHTIPAPTR